MCKSINGLRRKTVRIWKQKSICNIQLAKRYILARVFFQSNLVAWLKNILSTWYFNFGTSVYKYLFLVEGMSPHHPSKPGGCGGGTTQIWLNVNRKYLTCQRAWKLWTVLDSIKHYQIKPWPTCQKLFKSISLKRYTTKNLAQHARQIFLPLPPTGFLIVTLGLIMS